MKLPDYKNYTTKALLEAQDTLYEDLDQNLAMDGSGELGGVIYKSYEPQFEAIEKELNGRDDYQAMMQEDHVEFQIESNSINDLWDDGDMDPAGGYGPNSHI